MKNQINIENYNSYSQINENEEKRSHQKLISNNNE